ncbi:MAG: type I-E CRISPR-associated protein Cse1/CasA [Proteobacteria bacterium]|nr:type I-E CRISPR-associated protein Cse1/CasA [Pseudomonadota bacterium]
MANTFDLTTEGWIPVKVGNRRCEVGLQEALVGAHRYQELTHSSPLVVAALHRLLLAFVHRCFGPEDLSAWLALHKRGVFDAETIDRYLDQWRPRLQLLDPERPFYQCAALPFESKPPEILQAERSNYGAPAHLFQHRPDGWCDLMPLSEAARHLVALQAFAPGGFTPTKSKAVEAAPLNRAALVLVRGTTLFETLMLNLLVYQPGGAPIPGNAATDLPAWEQDHPACADRRVPYGWLDLLTWQSRRVELRPTEEHDGIQSVVVVNGTDLDRQEVCDPMVAWKRNPKRGSIPLAFDVQGAVWRDSHALFRSADKSIRPLTLGQLGRRELRKAVPPERRLDVSLLGLRGDQAKILLAREERFATATRLLADANLGESLRDSLALAEEGGVALRNAVRRLAKAALSGADRKPEKNDVENVVSSLGTMDRYWSALKQDFDAYLADLGHNEKQARDAFSARVRAQVLRCYESARQALGGTARMLRAGAQGEATLRRNLHSLPAVSDEVSP